MKTPHRTIAIVCLMSLCSPLSAADAAKNKKKSYPPRPKMVWLDLGDAAPDFKLPGIDGKDHAKLVLKQ